MVAYIYIYNFFFNLATSLFSLVSPKPTSYTGYLLPVYFTYEKLSFEQNDGKHYE